MFENILFFIRKYKRWLNSIIAIALAILLYSYLNKTIAFNKVGELLLKTPFYIYLIALLGTLLNWSIEAKKWHLLINSIEKTSPFRAQSAVFAGVAVSNIFPFKIGEYLGKLYFIKKENHIKSLGLSFVSSITQMAINLALSIIPAITVVSFNSIRSHFDWYKFVLIILIFSFIIWAYQKWGKNHKLMQEFKSGLAQLQSKKIALLFGFSILRFLVFASAYVYVLHYFIPISIFKIYLGVGAIYFIQSFSPGMAATDASVRLTLPILIFGTSTTVLNNEIETAAVINYLFSVLIPSLIGLFIIAYQIFLKKQKIS